MNQYAAGIVLYHPDVDRLKENIDAVSPQVDTVYCYNNGLGDDQRVKKLLSSYDNVAVLGKGTNEGIAIALNRILERAHKADKQWLLTLDQDSVVCEGMIEAFASLTYEERAAIICPQVEDVRRKNEALVIVSDNYEDVDFCITSGSFMNVEIALSLGGFDEYLFIGLVDNEICMRLKYEGFRIIRNNSVVLNHELGDLKPSKLEKFYLKLGETLHSETIKKLSYKRKVNPMRVYYATRNTVYMKKKFVNYTKNKDWNKLIVKNSLSNVLRGGQKLNVLKAILKGIRDGRTEHVEPYNVHCDVKQIDV